MTPEDIVLHGVCIGCGGCASTTGSPFSISLNPRGMYEASESVQAEPQAAAKSTIEICPFSNESRNENQLTASLFADVARGSDKLGKYLENFVGYAAERDYREIGTSGGLITWLLAELLNKGLVDGVIHVRSCEAMVETQRIFHKYMISRTPEEVLAGAKSKYHPVEISEVMAEVRSTPGQYVFVGVPCFVKAVRLLAEHDLEIKQRIVFHVALVCGHLKSLNFSHFLAWQCGVQPGELRSIDYRCKVAGLPAYQYGVKVEYERAGRTRSQIGIPREFFGSSWGHGVFKPRACDFCDDVVGETADISIGDAWLPEYFSDWRGQSIVTVRSRQILRIIEDAMHDDRLHLTRVSAEEVERSQDASFRHRREGLQYRLARNQEEGRWVPAKRVSADRNALPPELQQRMDYRVEIAERSHTAFQEAVESGNLQPYVEALTPLIEKYEAADCRYRQQLAPHPKEQGLARRLCQLRKLFRRRGKQGGH